MSSPPGTGTNHEPVRVTTTSKRASESEQASPAGYISTADTKRNFLPFALLQAPLGAQPVAHSAVVSGTIVYVLRTIRLAIGSDPGDLPWTAEDSKMQSLAGGPPRGQNGEADRDRYSLKWTVPLHTGSVLDPNERLEH